MKFTSGEDVREALSALGRKLADEKRPKITLLICGGAALSISGLLTRTTSDVDVLGRTKASSQLQTPPEWLWDCAAEVAMVLGLERNWLNDAVSVLSSMGLPKGIIERATRQNFGPSLDIAVASRLDLIALKSFAAIDPTSRRQHLEDLVDLHPDQTEMEFAAAWLLDRPSSPEFRRAVAHLCKVLGHTLGAPGSRRPDAAA